MPKISVRNGNGHRAGTTKYDAHHTVISQTYGAFADLRRELSDSKETVVNREEILRNFAACPDWQDAIGRTRVFISARETFRPAGIAGAREPRLFRQSRGSRAGS